MKDYLIGLFAGAAGITAYGLVFIILLLAGFGLPLPEDIPLVMGGVLVHRGQASLIPMIIVGYLGILLGDSIMFGLGRRFGTKVGASGNFFARIVTPEKRARVEALFKKHGEKIVMLARFLPGVRTVTYFTAGSVGMSYAKFAMFDSIAALASAPIFVVLGYKFGADIDSLLHRIASGERNVIIGLVAIVAVVVLFGRWRAHRERKAAVEALTKKVQEAGIEPAPQSPPVEVRADGVEQR